MSYEWISKNARNGIAVISIILSIAVIIFVEGLSSSHKEDQLIINHICLLQIFSSIILFIGSKNSNRWLFLPWLMVAALFTYTMIYKSLFYWFHLRSDTKGSMVAISWLYLIAGCWLYFIYAVLTDFQDMQRVACPGKEVQAFVRIENHLTKKQESTLL
ncbi:uncharacterized protein LOC133842115 [Drosophila sulfurigaster albostrigata]|uniref:uncharacterized protein LOC133842115 n=1 Tax=Drosophila sulfurigaster albostrigata TaxID=89887 RepID=UPI002D2198F8|nr:uncharacterized protein LOC133842115 [Drosophila sulfurigaster albostrigata]